MRRVHSCFSRPAAAVLLILVLGLQGCGAPQETPPLADADRAFAQGLFLEAEKAYQAYLEKNPSGSERWKAWSRLLFIGRMNTPASEYVFKLLQAMQQEFGQEAERARSLHLEMAEYHAGVGRPELALEELDLALGLSENAAQRLEVLTRRAETLVNAGRLDAALESLDRALGESPSVDVQRMLLLRQGHIRIFRMEWSVAETVLDQVVDAGRPEDSASVEARFALAEVYAATGRTGPARRELTAIESLYPNPLVIRERLRQLPE